MIKRADEAMIGRRQHEDYDVSDLRDRAVASDCTSKERVIIWLRKQYGSTR